MKIIQINMVYPSGSTGQIVASIHKYLKRRGEESLVFYGRGKNVKEIGVKKVAPEIIMKLQSIQSKLTGFAYAGCIISTKILIKKIKKEKPDVVHLHCINGYMVNIYKLLTFLKTRNIPTVITLHAEFYYTAGCSHSLNCDRWIKGCHHCPQKKNGRPSSKYFDRSAEEWVMMRDAFADFKYLKLIGVSDWISTRAKKSSFFKRENITTIENGIDTENTFYLKKIENLKRILNIEKEKIVLHVTSDFYHPLKGSEYIIELAKYFRCNKNVKFVIIGIDKLNTKFDNLIIVPYVENQNELATYYSMADLTVITSLRETFSLVCAESLSCGTPVVGFFAGGPETIAIDEYSEFVHWGNSKELKNVVEKWLDKKINKYTISQIASQKYSQNKMNLAYFDLYKKMVL